MGLSAGLDRYGKPHPPPGFDPRTVQPVAVAVPTELPGPLTMRMAYTVIHRTVRNSPQNSRACVRKCSLYHICLTVRTKFLSTGFFVFLSLGFRTSCNLFHGSCSLTKPDQASSCLPISLAACISASRTGRISVTFDTGDFGRNLPRNPEFG